MTKRDWELVKAQLRQHVQYWPTFAIILVDIAVAAFCWWLRSQGWVASILSSVLLGFVLHHAYLLLHEATHSAIAKQRSINVSVGHVCGWLIAMPFLTRQRSHLLHHTWAGHPEGDPANKRVIARFAVMSDAQAAGLERIWRSWLPLLILNDRLGLWRDPFRQQLTRKRFSREMRASRLYVLGYALSGFALFQAGMLAEVLCWYLPACALQLALEELINLPHHAETPLLDVNEQALPLWEQHRVTHSCQALRFWSPWLLLNFNLHTAHHLFPWVPWSGLPAAHRKLLPLLPALRLEQTRHELSWSLRNRRRSLLEIMAPYFDRIPRDHGTAATNAIYAPASGSGAPG